MTNREFIIAEVQKEKYVSRLIDAFESLYEYSPDKFPVRSACEHCMKKHGGECPDNADTMTGALCDAAELEWLDAEVVPK